MTNNKSTRLWATVRFVVIFANVEISLTRTDVPQAGIEKNFRNEIETNSTIEIIIMETSHVTININNAMVKEITDNLTKLQEDQIGTFLNWFSRESDLSLKKSSKTEKGHVIRIDMVLTVTTKVLIVVVLVMILDVMMTEDDHSIPIDRSIRTIHVINRTVMTSRIVVGIAMVTIKVEWETIAKIITTIAIIITTDMTTGMNVSIRTLTRTVTIRIVTTIVGIIIDTITMAKIQIIIMVAHNDRMIISTIKGQFWPWSGHKTSLIFANIWLVGKPAGKILQSWHIF